MASDDTLQILTLAAPMPPPQEKLAAEDLLLSVSHPLMDELSSLREAVVRFQKEAHSPFIKLQRYGLDTSVLTERVTHLEAENALLNRELAVLRENRVPPEKEAQQDTVAQLTLALRRLSAKLSFTEAALSENVLALTQATALAAQHAHASANAFALAARVRGREEEGRLREQALELEVLRAREEAKLSDHVVGEYAALVRTLERRSGPAASSNDDSPNPASALPDAKAQLTNLAVTYAEKNAELRARVTELEGQLEVSEAQLGAAGALSEELSTALAQARFAAEQARVDDQSVAGMVERYMKFTQQTTSTLHQSLQILRRRYSATLSTLQTQLAARSTQLHASKAETERLGSVLDRMGGALIRETAGRRREVEGRVRLVGREEGVVRALRAVVREAEERRDGRARRRSKQEEQCPKETEKGEGELDGEAEREREGDAPRDRDELEADLQTIEAGVRSVLEGLDSGDGGHGSQGRMVLLESTVEMLVGELKQEVARRKELERWVRDIDGAALARITRVEAPDLIDLNTPTVTDGAPGPLASIASPSSDALADTAPLVDLANETATAPLAPTLPDASPDPADASLIHPLPADLAAISKRYDALQRAFHDCHLTLEALRAELAAPGPAHDALRSAVARLHDYTEDARVELDIRIADVRVLARGWQTLAQVRSPGATEEKGEGGVQVQGEVADFVRRDGQAQETFRRKLADVEHDIAIVKRVLDAAPGEPALPSPTVEKEKEVAGTAHALEGLGLRVAMPAYVPLEGAVGPVEAPRQRTVSGLYMLGLGVEGRGSRGMGLPRRIETGVDAGVGPEYTPVD